MLLISNACLAKSLPVGERWEGGEQIYNSQCLGLPALASASSADITGVWGTKNGCRRRMQKRSSLWAPASSNKSVLCKLALFTPKWGTAKSSRGYRCCEGSKEHCWPSCREGTQQQQQQGFFLGFPKVPGMGWPLDSCRRFLLFLAILPSLPGSSCST